MTTTSELLHRVDASWKKLEQQVNALSSDQLTTAGPDGWSVKDHLAHVSAWEESLIALLEGRERRVAINLVGAQSKSYPNDVDAINALIQRRSKDRPLADILATFQETHRRVVAVIGRLTDEDLSRPYSYFQPNDQPHNANPVISWIEGNTYEHYDEHAAWIDKLLVNA